MPLRIGSLRSLTVSAMLWLSLAFGAAAQSAMADPPALPHYLFTASAGVPLRLAPQDAFDQGTLAPVFTDVLGGYVFPGRGSLRHGAGLGLSLNVSEDGGFTEPVLRYEQIVIMPSYLLSVHIDPQWFALGHAGLPIVAHGGATFGGELAFAFGLRLLAGFGVFAEGSVDAFIGMASTVHATVSLEGGLFLDYEVLP